MSPTDLPLLRRLLAEGSSRPWRTDRNHYSYLVVVDQAEGVMHRLAECGSPYNATLIATAVNALPGVLDELEALRAELAQVRQERDIARAELAAREGKR